MTRVPSGTGLRFAALIALTVSVTVFVHGHIYSGGLTRVSDISDACHVRAELYPTSTGMADPDQRKWDAYQDCMSGHFLPGLAWIAAGLLVLAGLTTAIYLLSPWWRIRRSRLCRLDDRPGIAELLREPLASAAATAGLARLPQVYLDPAGSCAGGVAFGTRRRPRVCLDAGLVALLHQNRASFDAIVLHELAHVRAGDIPLTYLTIAVWRACVCVAVLPWLLYQYVPVMRLLPQQRATAFAEFDVGFMLRVSGGLLLLAGLILLTRNAVLRSREREADALVVRWTGDTDPYRSLSTGHRRRRVLRWLATHPTAAARRAAMADPRVLLRPGVLEAFATGLAIQVGFEHVCAAMGLVGWYQADNGSHDVMRGVWGLLLAVPVGVIAWRGAAFLRAGGRARMVFARSGLALGLGVTAGLLVHLERASLLPDPSGPRVVALTAAPVMMMLTCVWAGYCARLLGRRVATARGLLLGSSLVLICTGLFGVVDIGLDVNVFWSQLLGPWLAYVGDYGHAADRPVVQAAVFVLVGNPHPGPAATTAALAVLWLVPVLLSPRPARIVRPGLLGAGVAVAGWLALFPVWRAVSPGTGPEETLIRSAWEIAAAAAAQLALAVILHRRRGWATAALGTWSVGTAATITLWLAHWHAGQLDSLLTRRPLQILAVTGLAATVVALGTGVARRPASTTVSADRRRPAVATALAAYAAACVASIVWAPTSVGAAPIQPPDGPPPPIHRALALTTWYGGGGGVRVDGIVKTSDAWLRSVGSKDPVQIAAACQGQLRALRAAAVFPPPPMADVRADLSDAIAHITANAEWCVEVTADPTSTRPMPDPKGRGLQSLLKAQRAFYRAQLEVVDRQVPFR
ncbi:M48 family metalloprotease [Catenuloplanes japonicus]|uniref:M48 family metalloprotease n=1 Tax=Catenuloplanes japonicus TaxID=33876 RepID=UPI0005274672|nr:M48 family metalloprotease [Catenuloplanes japonicus]